ncbi:MAG: hypothetical protein PHQ23_08790, partial [Candidatus Wallbacteria bacterium]|nr:hypothetical protein [Candidatus Wallbacteria bacterium]
LLGPQHNRIAALLLMTAAGAMNGFININIITIVQLSTPGAFRGRVFGLLGTLCGGIAPIAMGLGGLAADLLNQNIPLLFMCCGGTAAVLSFSLAFDRSTREFLAWEQPSPS